MNYKMWIGYLIFFIVLFGGAAWIADKFNIVVLIVATVCYAIAIIPFIKKRSIKSAKKVMNK
ncbi:hypothetical protein AAV22_15365 [Listeria monocytogenes]|nr:hypothetical protein [Listeria monocytogenes]EAF1158390.1 hypothetical protein [Listeria monocytogenes]EEO3757037.1 hypothetical protein [Listeria monocytogenes]HAA9661151.1 hypothetical protein [Listeria monocytogenes]